MNSTEKAALSPKMLLKRLFGINSGEYHVLEVKNEDEDQHITTERSLFQSSWTKSIRITLLAIAATLMVALSCLGFWWWSLKSHNLHAQSSPSISRPCGNSSAEALANGCKFDQLMWAWYPSYCPHYANDKYLQAEPERPWQFFIDPYKKEVASKEDWAKALNNEVFLYGENREHLAHCVFMFLSLGQIAREGGRVVQKYMDEEHSEHCARMLLKASYGNETRYEPGTFAGAISFEQDC